MIWRRRSLFRWMEARAEPIGSARTIAFLRTISFQFSLLLGVNQSQCESTERRNWLNEPTYAVPLLPMAFAIDEKTSFTSVDCFTTSDTMPSTMPIWKSFRMRRSIILPFLPATVGTKMETV